MAGTKTGGQITAAKVKARFGDDFHAKIGAKGGRNSRTGGFYANRKLASIAGRKGGKTSRRLPSPRCERNHAMTYSNTYHHEASNKDYCRKCLTIKQKALERKKAALDMARYA